MIVPGGITNFQEPVLHRTSDGTLHVFYARDDGATSSLVHQPVSATGRLGTASTVVTGWVTVSPYVLDVEGTASGGIRVFFTGMRGPSITDAYGLERPYTAVSDASGVSWTLEPPLWENNISVSLNLAGTTAPDGTQIAAWTSLGAVTYRIGTGPVQTTGVPSGTQSCLSAATVGSEVYLAWCANGSGSASNGTFVQRVWPTLGPVQKAPGSKEGIANSDQPVGLAVRPGGGLFVSYRNDSVPMVWRVGAGTGIRFPKLPNLRDISLSAAPSGRLWLAYSDNESLVQVVRSNPAGTRWGSPTTATGRRAAFYSLAISGNDNRADLVAGLSTQMWHTQVLPALTLSASPNAWSGRNPRLVSFRVRDAGTPVNRARVAVRDQVCRTNTSGRCTITLPALSPRKLTVRATKSRFYPASTTVTIRR